jgi:putative transposase
MPDYRRFRVPGGAYFFTIDLLERRSDLLVRHIDALREAVRRTPLEWPLAIDSWAVLPEHLHRVITLPEGDDDFSNRIKAIKIRFVRAIPATERRSRVRVARGERAIWQRRFWQHAVRSDTDYARYMDYVHFNPLMLLQGEQLVESAECKRGEVHQVGAPVLGVLGRVSATPLDQGPHRPRGRAAVHPSGLRLTATPRLPAAPTS